MFYGQGIRWCHSFSPVTLSFQSYDPFKVGFCFYPIYEYDISSSIITIIIEEKYKEHIHIQMFHMYARTVGENFLDFEYFNSTG